MSKTDAHCSSVLLDPLIKNARAIHEKVIVLDSHIDFEPADLNSERNYTQRVETQFNLPNMIDGGLDALFFVIYVGQTRETHNPDALKPASYERAYKLAIEKFDAVRRFTGEIAQEKIELALTPSDVRRIYAKGKKVALMGVENGYPLGEDIAPRQRILRPGRPLSVIHPQRPQSARRFAHRRARRLEVEWRFTTRQTSRRRNESFRHHGRRLARIESVDDANRGAIQSADHRIPFSGPRALRRQP